MLQHPIKSKGHDAMTDQLKDKQRNGKLRLKKWKEGQRIMWEKSRVRRILRRWTRGEGRWMVKSSGWADDSRPDYPPTLSTSLNLFPDNQLHKTWYSSTHHSSLCVIHHWKYLIGGSILFFCYIPQTWQGMACTLTLPCLDTDEYFSSPHWYFRRVHIWVGVLISGWMALIAELCLNGGNLRTKAEVGPHNQQPHMQQKSNKNTNKDQIVKIQG